MYKLPDGQLDIFTLIHPLEDMLDPENRWVVRAKATPWDLLEQHIAPQLYSSRGAPAKPLRMMLGAMMISDLLNISDAETVRQIQENPYLQYFIGLQEFTRQPANPADPQASRRRRHAAVGVSGHGKSPTSNPIS